MISNFNFYRKKIWVRIVNHRYNILYTTLLSLIYKSWIRKNWMLIFHSFWIYINHLSGKNLFGKMTIWNYTLTNMLVIHRFIRCHFESLTPTVWLFLCTLPEVLPLCSGFLLILVLTLWYPHQDAEQPQVRQSIMKERKSKYLRLF